MNKGDVVEAQIETLESKSVKKRKGRPKGSKNTVKNNTIFPVDKPVEKINIDFSKLANTLILLVDPPPENISESVEKAQVRFVNIREGFYKQYLPSRMLIPKYPFTVTDGFVRKCISACVALLAPEYKFNRGRVAVSKFCGIILKAEGDFYSLIDRIIQMYLKEFFTFSLKFSKLNPWVVGGIRHQFEVEYLKMKFRDRPVISIGVRGECPGWVDKQFNQGEDMLEVLCAA